ncbi:hypothetical protein EC957_011884 [Mortierella hygrophila]|uniref:Ras GEF n=1 Tax=Mortierella hygrophila TaxID=979708 RepID=A0A9P6F8P0_9FUNG|nr:hypothetical protein EC957_011884 [Mortierella hygrophila]
MFSPDTTSSYGTLGILPTNVNSNIHNHHDRGNINPHIPSYHRTNRHTYSSPLNLQKHSQGRYTTSNYLAASSSSISSSSNPHSNQSSLQLHPTTTQVQHVPHSTSTAAPVSSHVLSLSTAEFDGASWNSARRHSELLQQQQLLYHDLSEFLARTATTTSKATDNNDATCTTTEETSYTVATGSQQSTKTSLSTINGTAAQLGGNGYNKNNDNHSKTDNNNIKDYTDMSSDLAADGDFIVRASHEYHTDSDGHLSFTQFQYIKVRHCDASGWWFGESENNRGWFPSNRVERVPDVYESEITSEDYDQIRTGLDGVEIQFLGEPVMESLVDSIQLDWGAVDNSGVASSATSHAPAGGRTRAGQLAFPPTQLSVPQPAYGSEGSSTDMESEMFYQHAISSTTSVNTADITYAYSDFVSEVTLYVMELRDATSKAELDRYQPIVAKVFSCVKALLIFTNTIARESPVLATYPELARSRRVILRALGKLYSKCRVANGSQTLTTTRQRQFATEKLGIFSGQVLEGITDFATCAREIGLRIRAEATSTHEGELEMVLNAKGEVDTSPPNSNSHGRPRRRVSRANSAKGFKSFNAVRQWKTEHLQKHNAAKKAVEFLLSEYMECLNGSFGSKGLSGIIRTTLQSAQAVEAFYISADDTKVRTYVKEDEQYIIHKTQLSSTLIELFEFIHIMENVLTVKGPSSEIILNRLMNLASVLLKCLIDLEIPSKGQNSNQESSQSSTKRISFSQDQQDTFPLPGFSPTPSEESQIEAEERHIREHLAAKAAAAAVSSKGTTSRNTAPARPKQPTTSTTSQGFPLNRKFASLTSLSDQYKRQVEGDHHCVEMDAYGEAHDLERNHVDFYRPSHDSAVVITSGKNTPHHSIMNGQKGAKPSVSVVEEDDHLFEAADPRNNGNAQEQLNDVVKDAERAITALYLPVTEAFHQLEQEDAPAAVDIKQRGSLPVQGDPAVAHNPKSPSRPVSRLQNSSESRPTNPATRTVRPGRSALVHPTATSRIARTQPGASNTRNGQSFVDLESEELSLERSEMTGLGLSMPASARAKKSSSATSSAIPNQGAGSGANIRPSGIARVRNPIPASPRLESSKRMPRRDPSPHPHSPSMTAESRTSNRSGGHTNTNLVPGMPSSSRRGSVQSIRSEVALPRKSSESQAMREQREHEPRQDYQDRRQQQHQHQQQYHQQQQQQQSQATGRRGSKASMNGSSLRSEAQASKNDDSLLSGLLTPTTPHIQTFVEGQGARRSGKTQRRESVISNLSVATESSVQSRSGGRPLSPNLRSRNNNQDANSVRGRVSTESAMSVQQQSRGGPSPTTLRARQNRTGLTRARLSGEFKHGATPATATPWFLEDDYEPEEVHYNDNGTLVAATLEAFVEMLTTHKNAPDTALVMTFFTTFRLFTTPLELTELLIKRFMQPPPSGLNENELTIWAQQKQDRVQKRVHIAFKTWLEGYWVTEKDREAFRPITEFVTHEMKKTLPGPAGRLLDMLTQWGNKRRSLCLGGRSQTINRARSHDRLNQFAKDQQQAENASSSSSKPFATVKDKSAGRKGLGGLGGRDSTNSRGPPAPAVTKALLNALSSEATMTKVPVTDVKAVELARQTTILVSKLYADIPYLELLNKDKPTCSRMIQVSNKITEWLIETVVDEQDVKRRATIVKHWIEVGEECLKMNNFDTLMAITNGIESTPVSRLYNTWEGINKGYLERFLQLKKAISSDANYSAYRNKLKTVQTPCIPFLGLFFKAITYIEDGNSPYKELTPPQSSSSASSDVSSSSQAPPTTPVPVSTRKLLRYGRFHQLAKAVQEFRSFQGSYELLEVPRLRDYINKCMENQDPERSYTKSLAIEPRRPAPGHIPGAPGRNGGGQATGGQSQSQQQRASGGHRSGLFQSGVSSSEMNSGSGPVKLNKLSFFRKSIRTERS